MKISGSDVGEFGDAPLRELSECLNGTGTIELFIDAREVRGASVDVSSEWAGWLRAHKAQLGKITMLTGSRFVQVTADFVRRFADGGGQPSEAGRAELRGLLAEVMVRNTRALSGVALPPRFARTLLVEPVHKEEATRIYSD